MDGLLVAWAVWMLDQRWLAVGCLLSLHLLNLLTSRYIHVWATPDGFRVHVQDGPNPFRATELLVSELELRSWRSWFGAGFELRAADSSLTVRYAGRRAATPVMGARCVVEPRPRLRVSLVAVAQAAPNLVALATIVAVSWQHGHRVLVALPSALCAAASVARALTGGSYVALLDVGEPRVATLPRA